MGTRLSSTTGKTDSQLAYTGSNPLVWMRLAIILLGLGIIGILLPKKRAWKKSND